MGKFKEALDKGTGKAQHRGRHGGRPSSSAPAARPNFFINGRNLSGAQPFEEFKEVIDEEIGAPTS